MQIKNTENKSVYFKAESVSRGSRHFAALRSAYIELFPREERLPMWLLLLRAKNPNIDLLAFIDEAKATDDVHQFCGFVYTVRLDDLLYIFYLAVNPSLHSKGFGSRILAQIEVMYPNCRYVLECEDIRQACDNGDQRARRRRFYMQNGYVPNALKTAEGSVNYEMMVKGGSCSKDEYSRIMRQFGGPVFAAWFKPKFI